MGGGGEGVGAEGEEGRVVGAQEVDLVRGELGAHVCGGGGLFVGWRGLLFCGRGGCGAWGGHGEEEGQGAADGPVEVLEAVDAVGVVGEESTLR